MTNIAQDQDEAKAELNKTQENTKKLRSRKKKKICGTDNWKLLCPELETKPDPLIRKSHSEKIKSDQKEEEEGPAPKVAKKELWFDDVDESLLEESNEVKPVAADNASSNALVKADSFQGPTKCIGIDCEMVGIGAEGQQSVLARVSLVNIYGNCLYDKYVNSPEKVTDYRTHVSGITEEILKQKGEPFSKVQEEVSDIITGKTLVGHALQNDLKVLFLSHPRKDIRDTSTYKPFRKVFNGQKPSLKRLTEKLLGVKVQDGAHSSVEDAQAAMRLYTMHRKKWEKEVKNFTRLLKKKKAKLKKKGKEKN